MGPLNKERIVFLIAAVIAVYGFATAFSSQGYSGSVPGLPPSDSGGPPRMDTFKVVFLDNSFDYYWGADDTDRRDPWKPPKKTRKPTPEDFPMREPELVSRTVIVPVPPSAPLQEARPVLRQTKAPPRVEEEQPGTAPPEDDTGTEGDGS